ncbi:MAG: AAA family ATPase [Halodesulfurarchaeum sp.]
MCDACGGHGSHDHSHDHDSAHTHDHDRSPDQGTRIKTDGTLKAAITGKGGVGKTTLAAAVARHLAAHHDVVALDADPDMNLAQTLGVTEPRPITRERELIQERAGNSGGLISLTPEVRDVIETHSTPFGAGGQLLTIGAPAGANSGCMCPENSFVRSLVSSALAEDYVVMDMEAGVEHLGRGTAESVDAMIVVVEPSRASIQTANRIRGLAGELGIDAVRAVVNKASGNATEVREVLDIPVIATLPYDEDIATASLAGNPPVEASERLQETAASVISAFRA